MVFELTMVEKSNGNIPILQIKNIMSVEYVVPMIVISIGQLSGMVQVHKWL